VSGQSSRHRSPIRKNRENYPKITEPCSNRHQTKSTPTHCLEKLILARLLAQPDGNDILSFVVADDNAHAKKPNSGQDALNDAARVGTADPTNGEDDKCRSDPDKAKRSNARWLAMKISIEAQRDASQGGSTEPQSNVEGVHRSNLAEAAAGKKH
jgi:hypothetical protein